MVLCLLNHSCHLHKLLDLSLLANGINCHAYYLNSVVYDKRQKYYALNIYVYPGNCIPFKYTVQDYDAFQDLNSLVCVTLQG